MKKRVIIILIVLLVVIIAGVFYFTREEFRCSLKPHVGRCDALFERYYFDSDEGVCKEFIWGGCGGVVPFDTIEECRDVCES